MRLEAVLFSSLLCLGGPLFAAVEAPADSTRGNTLVTQGAAPESLETSKPVPGGLERPADAGNASTPASAAASAVDSSAKVAAAETGGTTLKVPFLSKLTLGGTVQLKAFYHNFASDHDADKSLSLNLRRLRLDLEGAAGEHFGFLGQFRLEANGQNLGLENGYLSWKGCGSFGLKGGKMKRPFSQESLQSSKSLYTVERGTLYQTFLSETTGYSDYDLGLTATFDLASSGLPVTVEAGVFNGKQNQDSSASYANQQAQAVDKGFRAKDFVARVSGSPMKSLKAEAAVSTKAAEDRSNRDHFLYEVNTAYELGLDFTWRQLRLLGEFSWGDNHMGLDSRILSGSGLFVGFYTTAVWREDYTQGRASELVLKLEGLDPDARDGRPNDGFLRYTLGLNYFFTPRVSLLADYGVLQPVTGVTGRKDLQHDIDVMWRMSF